MSRHKREKVVLLKVDKHEYLQIHVPGTCIFMYYVSLYTVNQYSDVPLKKGNKTLIQPS